MKKILLTLIGGAFLSSSLLAQTTTFNYTGGAQTYTVPAGVVGVEIHAYGAEGASGTAASSTGGAGGLGGHAYGTLAVSSGNTLTIYVGGKAVSLTGGYNGGGNGANNSSNPAGGGGGASDVRIGAGTLGDRVIVAGGGGGGGTSGCLDAAAAGGNGGGGGGISGANGTDSPTPGGVAGGGFGGNGSIGGLAGIGCAGFLGAAGAAGAANIGGDGGLGQTCCCATAPNGGGGGGGYLGGGGGGGGSAGTTGCSGNDKGGGGGGAGGTSYIGGVTDGMTIDGVQSGDGYVEITPIFGNIYTFTGGSQTYTVPACVTEITIEVWGGQGASGASGNSSSGLVAGGAGGLGGYVTGKLAVTPGDVLTLTVGGAGSSPAGGFNGGGNGGSNSGGGGGGFSSVTYQSTQIIVAGGGGGGGRGGCESAGAGTGGDGGAGGGGDGAGGNSSATSGGVAGGGFGGVGQVGGAAGAGCGGFLGTPGANAVGSTGANGGNGQSCCCFSFGSIPGGGGGGGGVLGGAGGGGGSAGTTGCSGNDKGAGGGGAGGTSMADAMLTDITMSNGIQVGDGMIVITETPYNHNLSFSAAPSTVCENGTLTFTATSNDVDYLWTVPAGASITGQGTANVDVTFPVGVASGNVSVRAINTCADTSAALSTFVTVNALPAVSLDLSGVPPFCSTDGAIAINGGTPASGVYSGNGVSGGMFDPAAAGAGTHTVTYSYTDGNGCSNSASDDLVVNAIPVPVLDLTGSNLFCTSAGDVVLAGGTPAGGTYSGAGVSSGMFSPSTAGAGTHTITYTVTDNGCVGTDTDDVVVQVCGGVTVTQHANDAVTVFPVPAKDYIMISWENQAKEISIQLFDTQGKLISSNQYSGLMQVTLDVSTLVNGAYLLQVNRDGLSSSQYITISK